MPLSTLDRICQTDTAAPREMLWQAYLSVRQHSLALAAPLSPEDQCIQSMPDASPTKWHLAHTSWFFESLILKPFAQGYRPFDERYHYLFNSYYEALGPRHPRPQRGLLTRPSHADILDYRRHVDEAMGRHLASCSDDAWQTTADMLELGLNHEQQHQELLLTDILHAFSCNSLLPAYDPAFAPELALANTPSLAPQWLEHSGGLVEIGHCGEGFAFDNETPRHPVWLQPYRIASRLVTNGEYLAFIVDGGYRRHELWLSDGWATVQTQGWQAPAYWLAPDDPRNAIGNSSGEWAQFGLGGVQPLILNAPVRNLSAYEACAYAEWAGARLPTEFEWEAASGLAGFQQASDMVWQWTRSSYEPYPGFRPLTGAVSEYNGKFMVGQMVLRGGSLATPPGHTRPTYRNFFPPAARWQFSGIRLARSQ